MLEEFTIETKRKYQLVDITSQVKDLVSSSGISEGMALIFLPHATAGLLMNENESGLKSDWIEVFKTFVPEISFAHNRIDNNAEAHLLAGLLGASKTLIVENGNLVLGAWQNIFLAEFDGPRTRRVQVKVVKG